MVGTGCADRSVGPDVLREAQVSLTVIELANSVIQGVVSVEGAGLQGVSVTLTGKESRSGVTDASGRFELSGLTSGGYTVFFGNLPAGVSFASTTQNVSLGVNDTRTVDFQGTYIRNSSISGAVTVEGSPLGGVTVTLGGTQTGSVVTNASGQYAFTGLRNGGYTVTVSNFPSGVTFPSTTQNVSVGVNDARTVDFPGSYILTSSVLGTVTAGSMGLEGVTVTLTGAESRVTSTNASGDYQFAGLRSGSYTVTITNLPAGTSFSTTSRSASVGVGQTVRLDFTGTVVQLPSLEYSYIEACPAVIPRYEEVDWRATITVGVRDQFAQPIQGATVLLSESPQLKDCRVSPPLENSFLITGPNGLASTIYNSCSEYAGPMTFTAQITANSSTVTLQESDDLYVDVMRWDYLLARFSGNGQTIQAGQSGSFSVRVLSAVGAPVQGVPVGWTLEGGNCLYSFTNASGIAGISLYVPPSTAPGLYSITANIADIDWQAEPWRLVNVVFTYQVVAPSPAPPAPAPSQEAPRLRGTALPVGGG